MNKYLVIGNPIKHSLSPVIHNYWINKYNLIDSIYEKRKVEKQNLEIIVDQIRNDELKGVNVTVPFKKEIIPFLDKINAIAKNTLTVNTLFKIKNEVWGYNTDVSGFADSLNSDQIFDSKNKTIFILGAGGVTSSIIYNFTNKCKKIYISNRTRNKSEKLKKLYSNSKSQIEVIDWGEKPSKCDLIINTTSVGLNKDENLGLDFRDYENEKNVLFYDIIYNPKETNFLKDARLRGNKILNGRMMFLYQARISYQIWTGILPEIDNEIIKLMDK